MVWKPFAEVVKACEDAILEKHAALRALDKFNPLLNLVRIGSHGPVYTKRFTDLCENDTDSFFEALGNYYKLLERELTNSTDYLYCMSCPIWDPFLEKCGVYNMVNATERRALRFKAKEPCTWKIRKNQNFTELTPEQLVTRINNHLINRYPTTTKPLSIEDITNPLKIRNLSATARRLPM